MDTALTGESLTPLPPAAPSAGASAPDLQELKTVADAALKEAREKWDVLWNEAQKFIRENPGKSVLAALGAGFLLGILFKD